MAALDSGARGVLNVALAALFLLPTGCIRFDPSPAASHPPALSTGGPSPVVVAMIDTGIDPYPNAFQVNTSENASLAKWVGDLPVQGAKPVQSVHLSRPPSYAEARSLDEPIWRTLHPNQLYWFEGTRILAISFTAPPPGDTHLFIDSPLHGTHAASAAINADAHAVILEVETNESPGTSKGSVDYGLKNQTIAAMEWIAQQPWIQEVSLSFGSLADSPDPAFNSFANATHDAVTEGKLVFASTADAPDATITGPVAGPPWVIAVGGVVNQTRGDEIFAGRFPDIVGPYVVPNLSNSGSYTHTTTDEGTSFAAPTVAGIAAKVLDEFRSQSAGQPATTSMGLARLSDGRILRNNDLRHAINESATELSPTEYDPSGIMAQNISTNPLGDGAFVFAATSTPGNPAAPFVAEGWGYVGSDAVGRIMAILRNPSQGPGHSPDQVAFMRERDIARHELWPTST
ncbi:MAG: S8/S53 family peptidase [Thermoplasmatota archaeon]